MQKGLVVWGFCAAAALAASAIMEARAQQAPAAPPAPVETAAQFLPRCIEWMRRRIDDESPWRVWVLTHNDTIVGNIWLELVEKLPNPNVEREMHAYVTNFFIRPEYRNTGAGSRLLEAVLDECKRAHVDSVFLWPSDRSRPLYERYGFTAPSTMLVLEQH